VNLFFGALFIAIVKGIDDPFAYGHSDAVAIIFAKSSSLRYAKTHFLGEIDAFNLRLQSNFKMFGVLWHAGASPAPNRHGSGRLMGNIRTETESMEHLPDCGVVVPVGPASESDAVEMTSIFPEGKFLCPVRPVQCSVLNGLAQMAGLDVFRRIKIGYGARHLQNAVVRSRRES